SHDGTVFVGGTLRGDASAGMEVRVHAVESLPPRVPVLVTDGRVRREQTERFPKVLPRALARRHGHVRQGVWPFHPWPYRHRDGHLPRFTAVADGHDGVPGRFTAGQGMGRTTGDDAGREV